MNLKKEGVLLSHSLSSLSPQSLGCIAVGPLVSEKHHVEGMRLRDVAHLVVAREQKDRGLEKVCPSETPPGDLLPQSHVTWGPPALNSPVIGNSPVEYSIK